MTKDNAKNSRSQLPQKEIVKSIHKIIGDGKNFYIWYFKGTYIFIWFAIERLVTVRLTPCNVHKHLKKDSSSNLLKLGPGIATFLTPPYTSVYQLL